MAAAKGLEAAEPAVEIPADGPALHVLTNRRGIYGASCMLYRDIIKDFADQEETDVIILPSSIHEVLLFPDHLMFDHAFLCRTVQEINREDVSEEDVLSDRIYIFSRKQGPSSLLRFFPVIGQNQPEQRVHGKDPHGNGSGDLDGLQKIFCSQRRVVLEEIINAPVYGGSRHCRKRSRDQKH